MAYYLRLKDQSTTFYDMTSGISLVRDRVVKLKTLTGRLKLGINNGLIIQLTEKEGEAAYNAQNPVSAKAEVAKEPVNTEPVKEEAPEPEKVEETSDEGTEEETEEETSTTPRRRRK